MITQPPQLQISLAELLQGITTFAKKWDRNITGLSLDSRTVQPGDLFFAYQGTQQDGRMFIAEAIAKGASAIITEASQEQPDYLEEIPVIHLQNVCDWIGPIASRFYGNPSQDMCVIGITGTNGKTSTCHFIAHCLQAQGQKTGIIGTLGNGPYGNLIPSALTTTDAISLQKLFYEFRQQNIDTVVMEVASHALVQGRVNAVKFDLAIFTNLTRDHLDYHGNMDNYAAAKRRLFFWPTLKAVIINADDAMGQQLIQELTAEKKKLSIFTYSITAESPPLKREQPQKAAGDFSQIYAHQINFSQNGMSATVQTPWGDGLLHSSLLGSFNLSNLLAVLTTLCWLKIPLDRALEALANLKSVSGRMELFNKKNGATIIVDFAHTPDALQQTLLAIRQHLNGKLWCVFGCGGDRDPGKRPIMGKIAETYADHLVITDDNPRHETPQQIVADILTGIKNSEAVVVEHNRRRAIAHAISCAHAQDVVLIAGKGHEAYQQIGDEKFPFNDALEVQLLLAEVS